MTTYGGALSHTLEPNTGENLARELSERRTEAFERLYAQLHERLFLLAARILGDTDEAADVTQEAFLKAFRDMPAVPTADDAQRWMHRVTVNACYDRLRRRRAAGAAPLHDLNDVPSGADPFEAAQLTDTVQATLAQLSPRYRTALVLKELHGLGNRDVADAMGISRGAAGVLLLRARAAFRRAFGEAAPAGAGRALGLAALLPTLPVPAALQSPPSFVEASAAGLPAGALSTPAAAAPLAGIAPATGAPVVGGVLTKLGAATAGKVALAVLGASAVVAGGVAVHSASPGDSGTPARTTLTSQGAGDCSGARAAGKPATSRPQANRDDPALGRRQTKSRGTAAGAGNKPAGGSGGDTSSKRARSGPKPPEDRPPSAAPGGGGSSSGSGGSNPGGASGSGGKTGGGGGKSGGGKSGGGTDGSPGGGSAGSSNRP